MIGYAQAAVDALRVLKGQEWAVAFVELRLQFFRRYQRGLICSTEHGPEFFEHILAGPKAWKEKGEYGNNFRALFDDAKCKKCGGKLTQADIDLWNWLCDACDESERRLEE